MEVVTAERGESNHLPLRRESGSVKGGGRGEAAVSAVTAVAAEAAAPLKLGLREHDTER